MISSLFRRLQTRTSGLFDLLEDRQPQELKKNGRVGLEKQSLYLQLCCKLFKYNLIFQLSSFFPIPSASTRSWRLRLILARPLTIENKILFLILQKLIFRCPYLQCSQVYCIEVMEAENDLFIASTGSNNNQQTYSLKGILP